MMPTEDETFQSSVLFLAQLTSDAGLTINYYDHDDKTCFLLKNHKTWMYSKICIIDVPCFRLYEPHCEKTGLRVSDQVPHKSGSTTT